jgi:hypothetical protein
LEALAPPFEKTHSFCHHAFGCPMHNPFHAAYVLQKVSPSFVGMKSNEFTVVKRLKPHKTKLAGGVLPLGWFGVSWDIDDDKDFKLKWTGKFWRIESAQGGVIYRAIRFSKLNKLKPRENEKRIEYDPATKTGQIVLDYDGWLVLKRTELAIEESDLDTPLKINIRPVRDYSCEYFRAMLSHPDPSYRQASSIALFSFILGAGFSLIGLPSAVETVWGWLVAIFSFTCDPKGC